MARLTGESLTIEQVIAVARMGEAVERLDDEVVARIEASRAWVERALANESAPVYGVTTGFGPLAQIRIDPDQTRQLSRNLVLSSIVGVGPALSADIVRAMMLIRINTFAKGHSGVRPELANTLRDMLNKGVTPYVPSKGSLGASGDLAPLASVAAVMSKGESDETDSYSGQAWYEGELLTGQEAMQRAEIPRVVLEAKEGLGLTNGTNFMVAAAALGLWDAGRLLRHAEIAAALSFEALLGITSALDERLHRANGQPGQIQTAFNLRRLLAGSQLINSLPDRVQDAYSLRCTPQVIGPIRDMLAFLEQRVTDALNAATDNPLLFGEGEIVSGGNFHGQGPSLWLDTLSITLAQLATISERRVFRMTAPELSEGLPSMLVESSGLDSGLMMPQYTAAALVSDNKTLAHPDSVDTIPSSANQEDHVSMGANAARHMLEILDNVRQVIAIELLTAAQAIDLRSDGPARLGTGTAAAYHEIRQRTPRVDHDRALSSDMEALAQLIASDSVVESAEQVMGSKL
ncbi:MAG: histidine ammonia-lyase [Anaerolineales bacterium]